MQPRPNIITFLFFALLIYAYSALLFFASSLLDTRIERLAISLIPGLIKRHSPPLALWISKRASWGLFRPQLNARLLCGWLCHHQGFEWMGDGDEINDIQALNIETNRPECSASGPFGAFTRSLPWSADLH